MSRLASESTPNQTEPTPFVVRPARFALSFLFVMSQSFKSFLLSRDSLGGSTSLLGQSNALFFLLGLGAQAVAVAMSSIMAAPGFPPGGAWAPRSLL